MSVLTKPVSFIATANSAESRDFYENKLGFELLSDDPFALVFNIGTTSLRIQKVDTVPKVNHTVLGWEVMNIKKCVSDLTVKDIEFEKFPNLPQDDHGIWLSPSGASIAWFKDPDGNILSVTEV